MTRKQFVKKLADMGYPVSESTIYNWENQNKITRPPKLRRNSQLQYRDEHLQAAIEFMKQTVDSNPEKIPVAKAVPASESAA